MARRLDVCVRGCACVCVRACVRGVPGCARSIRKHAARGRFNGGQAPLAQAFRLGWGVRVRVGLTVGTHRLRKPLGW